MSVKQTADLQQLIRDKSNDATLRALENGGRIDDAEIRQLENLSTLADVRRSVSLRRKLSAYHLGVIYLGIVLILSLLLARVNSTFIELDVRASGVMLVLDGPQKISSPFRVSRVSARGLESIDLAPDSGIGQRSRDETSASFWLERDDQEADKNNSSLQIVIPELPAGSKLWLAAAEEKDHYLIRFCSASHEPWQLNLRGAVNVLTGSGWRHRYDLGRVKPARLVFGREQAAGGGDGHCSQLSFGMDAETVTGLLPNLRVGALGFTPPVGVRPESESSTEPASTIVSGDLYLPSIRDRHFSLRGNRRLVLDDLNAVLHSLTLRQGELHLSLSGVAGDLLTGSSRFERSIMPSLLDWWMSRDSIQVIWSASLSLFALFFGVLRWLSRVD